MRTFVLALILTLSAFGQVINRFSASTGDVSVTTAYVATIQQPATGSSQVILEQIVVYCSGACAVSTAANGAAATSTAGTVVPILPALAQTSIPFTFWTASNVGAGTAQGGIVHVPASGTVVLCFARSCGNGADVIIGTGQGAAANFSATVTVGSATANVTFYVRSSS